MYIKALSYVYMKALSREEGREEGGARGVEAQLLDVHRCEGLRLQINEFRLSTTPPPLFDARARAALPAASQLLPGQFGLTNFVLSTAVRLGCSVAEAWRGKQLGHRRIQR